MKEIELQKQIRDYINYNGGFVWRQNAGSFIVQNGRGKQRMIKVGQKGISDIIGCWRGRFLAIEVKSKSKPTQFQLDFLYEINSRGGIGFVAYNLEDVIKLLKVEP